MAIRKPETKVRTLDEFNAERAEADQIEIEERERLAAAANKARRNRIITPDPGGLLVLDIETTHFKGNFGHLLMWAAKWVGGKDIYTARIDDHPRYGTSPKAYMNDKWMVQEVIELMNSAKAIIYHYGERFDLRFINTRALFWNLMPPARPTSIDTWKHASTNLAMTSNRLGTLSEFLNPPDQRKGSLDISQWAIATHGHKPTLDAMMRYNIEDIIATEGVYKRIRPLIHNHPYVVDVDLNTAVELRRQRCPACGSNKTKSERARNTRTFRIERRRCNACGNGFEVGRTKIA
jgi:hypothetical protein